MTRLLITGASGFIGGHCAVQLAAKDYAVTAAHHSRRPPEIVQRSAQSCLQLDLRDASKLKEEIRRIAPEVILHAAAVTSVGVAEDNPDLAEEVNSQGTANLVAACDSLPEAERPLIIYLSTDLVFDGRAETSQALTEEDSPQTATHYSRSKLEGEERISRYSGNHAVLRTALTYGAPIGENEGCMGWLLRGLRDGTEVRLFVDEWRTPVYVEDIAESVDALVRKRNRIATSGLYHLGGAERISRYDFGLRTAEVFGYSSEVLKPTKQAEVESQVTRARDASLCIARLESELGVSPSGIEAGLKRMKAAFTT